MASMKYQWRNVNSVTMKINMKANNGVIWPEIEAAMA